VSKSELVCETHNRLPPRTGWRNYVTARAGNYVTDNPSKLGNYLTADTEPRLLNRLLHRLYWIAAPTRYRP
jgi:hypothetical protein